MNLKMSILFQEVLILHDAFLFLERLSTAQSLEIDLLRLCNSIPKWDELINLAKACLVTIVTSNDNMTIHTDSHWLMFFKRAIICFLSTG